MKTTAVIAAVLAFLVGYVLLLGSFWTWLIMLAAGAVGKAEWGFVDLFPVGVLVSFVIGAVSRSGK